MAIFSQVLVVVVLLQSASCKTRDQRHILTKFEYIKKILSTAPRDVSYIDVKNLAEKDAMEMVAQNYISDGEVCIRFLNGGITNNTQSNEHGETLQRYLQTAVGFLDWIKVDLQKGNVKLQGNLREAIVKFAIFVPLTNTVVAKIKQATKNNELAINSIMDSVDNVFNYFMRLGVHLENKQASISELREKNKKVVAEALATLDGIPSNSYNVDELVVYLRQLKMFVHQLSDRLKLISNPNGVTATLGVLAKIQSEIQDHFHSKHTLSSLQNLYKEWLTEIVKNINGLDSNVLENVSALRTTLFDTLGIVSVFKIEFEILSKKVP